MNGETKTRRASEREREREGRVNNLHSDESIVLRQAHATVPIMALRLVDAPTTGLRLLSLSLLFSSPLGEEPRHRRSYIYIYLYLYTYIYIYILSTPRLLFFPPLLLISARIPTGCRLLFTPRILITIAIIPPRKFCLNARGLTIRRHVASLIILPTTTNRGTTTTTTTMVGVRWIQLDSETRKKRRESSNLTFVVRRTSPLSISSYCLFPWSFQGVLFKTSLPTRRKNTTKDQEEKRGRCMEEVARPGSWASTIPPFRVCRLLAKPEKTAVLAPPLRSMKIKCRCFLRTVPFYFCLDSWVWQEMDELRRYGRKWSRSQKCQFDIADRYI